MRKILFASLLFCFFASFAVAQLTTVTGTVRDLNGVPYAGAQFKAQLVTTAGSAVTGQPTVTNNSSASCKQAGFGNAPCQIPFQGTFGPTFLDGSGNLPGGGIQLQDDSQVTPAGTQWLISVNSIGNPPPLGTGPQTCSAAVTVTGASQSISASFAACPALSNTFSATDVVTLTTTFQDAQNALPSTGGGSGLGGGTIDARNCTQLPPSALNFGTFTQTKPLTILLGPCFYNFNRILLGNPGGNTISFHMIGCGFICGGLVSTNATVGQTLITSATNNQTQYDVIFQDLFVFNSATAGQDVFGFTPTSPNSLNGFVFQRLFIGFGTFSGGVTGSAIKIDASALGHGNIERILIDDNHIELAGGLTAPAISLIGAIGKETRILQNNFETGSSTPSGIGISLTSASSTAFPANVVIQSNTFDDAFLTVLEADGAVGVVFNGNIVLGTFGGTRNGIQMQVGTGTVHSSLDVSNNVFSTSATLAYVLKTTDASATATFNNNTIIGTPTTVFSGFTNNLVARNNTGGGLGIAQWEPTSFANLGTPANGSFVYCPDCTIANPCAGAGTGAFAKRLNGVWVCN